MNGLSLCIVNHDGLAHLRATLPAVCALRSCFEEILLLDNASTDASRELFAQMLPSGRVIRLPENRSPGAARSAGFEAASQDRILFMDNDIHLTASAVEHLARALEEHPDCVIAMPRVVLLRRPGRIQYEGAYCHWLGHMILRNEDAALAPAPDSVIAVDSMISACFLLDRSRWPAPSFFDVGYRFYFEDHDVGVRARLAGRRLLAVPQALVFHGEGTVGLSLRPGGKYAARRVQTLFEGRWRHVLKTYSARTLSILAPALLTYELLQFCGAACKGWLRPWRRAVRYTWASRHELRAARHRLQTSRCVKDQTLLRGGPLPFKPELTPGRLSRWALGLCNQVFEGYWRLTRRLLG